MSDPTIFGRNAPNWRKEEIITLCERLWSDRKEEGAPRLFGQEPDLSWTKEALLGAVSLAAKLSTGLIR